jgi:hypothetical protein
MATDTTTPTNLRDEFRNTTDGFVGVVQFVGPHREPKGVSVDPHGTVWLNEDEQILTANAPRSDDDNPFVNGTLELVTRGREVRSRRPYGEQAQTAVETDTAPEEETGSPAEPAGAPEEGSHAAGEEVATPQAIMQPKPERATPARTHGRRRST